MKKVVVIFGFLLLACFSGGCAVIPAIVTTGASFAVPQSASLAISAVGTVHKTALVAADERQVDEMISDKMATIQAEAILLTERGVDMEATCLNGDLYVVGEYATPADRDRAIKSLEEIQSVNSVKGVVKPMPSSLVALIKPAIADSHAETVISTGLIKELHIKSANVDVHIVQGEAVIVGVVENATEAESIVRLVEKLKPDARTPIKVTSLLVQQDIYEAGLPQRNNTYALNSGTLMLADATQASLPETNSESAPVIEKDRPTISSLAAYIPADLTPWQKARQKMKRRILSLAKSETDPKAKRQLISLSAKVRTDTMISIEDRLVRTMNHSTNLAVRSHINAILTDIAPHRTLQVQTIAMH